MKKIKIFIFTLIFAAFITILCSCSENKTQYTVEKNSIVYEVNKESNTISDGTNTYEYTFSGNDYDYRVDITYPDGSTYWWDMNGYSGSGGWSDDYNPEKYVDGDILTDVILEDAPKASNIRGGDIVAIILLILIGILNIALPDVAWYLEYGWRYKDAEPSDAAIIFNRIGGVVAIVIAVVIMIM